MTDLPAEHQTTAQPTAPATAPALDLDRIEADLAAAEMALARLDSGEYWRDEVTGAELPDAVLEDDPVARRAPSA